MKSHDLLMLIQSDPTALALAHAGNDEGCATRCCEIAPKEVRQTLLTELDVMRIITDPFMADAVLRQVESVAGSNPVIKRILKWLEPGSSGVDFGDGRVRDLLIAPVESGGAGLTVEQVAPLLAAAEYAPNITAVDVGEAMKPLRG